MPHYYCRLPRKEVPPDVFHRCTIDSHFDRDSHFAIKKNDDFDEASVPKTSLVEEIGKKERSVEKYEKTVLEVACGLGDFLIHCAEQEEDTLFVGIDYALPVIERAVLRASEKHLSNILFFYGRLEDFCVQFEAMPFFDGVMINFPDPWPKKKHLKRRIINKKNVESLLPFVKEGGVVAGATDLADLHKYHLEELALIPQLKEESFHDVPLPYYGYASSFEKRGIKENRVINYFYYRKYLK